MKIETIKKFLDETNWKFNEKDYSTLCELSGGLTEAEASLTKQYIISNLNEDEDFDLINIIRTTKWKDIVAELVVRGLIDGWVEDELLFS